MESNTPLRVKLLFVSWHGIRLLYWLISRLHALWQGVCLGLLTREHLSHTIEAYYRWDPSFSTGEHNRRGLFPWEVAAVDRFFSTCQTILVTAAGGGREVLALCRRGYSVTAFEGNCPLVETANQILSDEDIDCRVVHHPYDEPLPECGQLIDGAIVGWGSYSHIQGRLQRIEFLRGLGQILDDGAPVLVSFLRRADKDLATFGMTAGIANTLRKLRSQSQVELGDSLIDMGYFHCFSNEEVLEEAQAAGYEVVFCNDFGYGHVVLRRKPRTNEHSPGITPEQ